MSNLEVTYLVVASNTVLKKTFSSPYHCWLFINKCRHSKKVQLISCPLLDYA